jgi:hypothetical protein
MSPTTKGYNMPIRTNPFSGETAELTEEQAALHDEIKNAELNEDYDTVRKGLSKFAKLNPSAYMTLLD